MKFLFIIRSVKNNIAGTPLHIFQIVTCRRNLPRIFAVGICRSYLPSEFAMAICRGFVLCM